MSLGYSGSRVNQSGVIEVFVNNKMGNAGTTAMPKVKFKHIYFSSRTGSRNLYKSLLSPLPGTNLYWCHIRNHG